MTAVSVN